MLWYYARVSVILLIMLCHTVLLSYACFLGASKVEPCSFVLLIIGEVLQCI
jgi:hypothetical protein